MNSFRPALLVVFVLCLFFAACGSIQQSSSSSSSSPGQPITPHQPLPKPIQPPPVGLQFDNVEDNPGMAGWSTCVIDGCHGGTPGGEYPPSSYSLSNGNTQISCSGSSAVLTETSANVQGAAYSNILAYYKAGSHDSENSFTVSFCFYLSGTINEAEFDTFQFNKAKNTEFMWGTQCVAGGDWDIWNQKTVQWVSLGSSVPCTLTFNAYHNLSKTMHWDPSDTGNCDGQICMYFDSIVLDGNTICEPCGSPQPSGVLPTGWGSDTGIQFQLDITDANKTGTMYIDEADLAEYDN